ncbi:hypothetical protein BDZ88DRAFT_448314 [Geranomyces variabilis]|nr:hypothetical protein BDZ88DRAFT_448314 [Geranomyces variabilis]KAJ3143525.1 hypothetical protein HDU90_000287 [Geranomyces variabilis]
MATVASPQAGLSFMEQRLNQRALNYKTSTPTRRLVYKPPLAVLSSPTSPENPERLRWDDGYAHLQDALDLLTEIIGQYDLGIQVSENDLESRTVIVKVGNPPPHQETTLILPESTDLIAALGIPLELCQFTLKACASHDLLLNGARVHLKQKNRFPAAGTVVRDSNKPYILMDGYQHDDPKAVAHSFNEFIRKASHNRNCRPDLYKYLLIQPSNGKALLPWADFKATAIEQTPSETIADTMDSTIAEICEAIGFAGYEDNMLFRTWVEDQTAEGECDADIVFTYLRQKFAQRPADVPFEELCALSGLDEVLVRKFLLPVPDIAACSSADDLLWMFMVNQYPALRKSFRECPFTKKVVAEGCEPDYSYWTLSKDAAESLKKRLEANDLSMTEFLAEMLEAYDNSAQDDVEPPDGFANWYHGTDGLAASHICKNILLSEGRVPGSFGVVPSFFVIDKKRAAMREAWKKMLFDTRNSSYSETAAVVRFEVETARLRDEYTPNLCLLIEDSFTANHPNWERDLLDGNDKNLQGDYHHVVSRSRAADNGLVEQVRQNRCDDPIVPRRIQWVQGVNHKALIKKSVPPKLHVIPEETILNVRTRELAQYFDSCRKEVLLCSNLIDAARFIVAAVSS